MTLQEGNTLDSKHKLKPLKPFLSSEPCLNPDARGFEKRRFLRVGGRIGKADFLSFNTKHPIIVNGRHSFIEKLILHYHKALSHPPHNALLYFLRKGYWIVDGKRNVSRIVYQRCLECQRQKALPYQPPMGDLPSFRLTPRYPMECIGLDGLGPFYVRDSENVLKCWVLLMTCAVTRVVHLELITDLTVDEFMNALYRMMARKGTVRLIYSDNAATHKRAEKELKKLFQNSQNAVSKSGIEWCFATPLAPWMGAFFERLVRCVKEPLRRVLRNDTYNFWNFYTLLCKIESVINSRPLTHLFSSPNEELYPLTPGHFLLG